MPDRALCDIGSRRELFVDRWLIDELRDVDLRLHAPRSAGVALRMDAPWEGPFSFYTTILKADERYLMTYRGWPQVPQENEQGVACTCLATSPDGIHWERPNLGLVEQNGSRANNILLHEDEHGAVCHNFAPLLDQRPGVPEAERFKALGGTWRGSGGLIAYLSADGIHWRRLRDEPVITHSTFGFDSQNVAFWSQAESCYVCYYRVFTEIDGQRVRWVTRRTSPDFVHWSEPVEMRSEGGPPEQIYTQQTGPYYRAPHHYLALAARFMPGRQAIDEDQARATGVDDRYWHDCSDGVLMTTRAGTTTYQRTFMEGWVRPGLGAENWTSRSNYPACGLVPTGAGVGTPREMSLYVNRRYGQPDAYVERLTLRPDGIASLHAGYAAGEMVTRPLVFVGSALELNYATSAAGSMRVEIQDEAGLALEGYALADCPEIIGDELDRVVRWQLGGEVGPLAGRPVRLRFALRDADLYAIRFR